MLESLPVIKEVYWKKYHRKVAFPMPCTLEIQIHSKYWFAPLTQTSTTSAHTRKAGNCTDKCNEFSRTSLLHLNHLILALTDDPDLGNVDATILPRVLQTLYVTTGCDYTSFFSTTKVYQFPLHCRCMQGLVYHGQNTLYQRCHHWKHLQCSTSAGVLGKHQCSLGWTSPHFSYIYSSLTHSPSTFLTCSLQHQIDCSCDQQ